MCESTHYLSCDYYIHNNHDNSDNFNEQYLKTLIEKNIKLINNFKYPVNKFSNLPKPAIKFINYCKDNNCKETIDDMNSFNIDKWHCKTNAWVEEILYGNDPWNNKKNMCRVNYDKIKKYR